MTKTAIVVDDHTDIRAVLGEMLEINGINVIGTGKNGKDAVELCQCFRPDIILLDVDMPEYDGIYALKQITSLGFHPVIVMVTGDKSSITADRIEKTGSARIIYKPPKMQEIIEAINRYAWIPISVPITLEIQVLEAFAAIYTTGATVVFLNWNSVWPSSTQSLPFALLPCTIKIPSGLDHLQNSREYSRQYIKNGYGIIS